MGQNFRSHTLCWDCANACCGCTWSQSLRPVKGWKAIQVHNNAFTSYIVQECPEFKRDAYQGGVKRMKKKEEATQ